MGSKIPNHFIDELLARTNIISVIKDRVAISKKGNDYMGCCPFHQEKSPSFSVSEKKQFFYCFGCGANGNAIGFLMQYDKMDFRQAIESLCTQAGMTMPESGDASPDHQPLLKAMAWACAAFQKQASHHLAQQFIKNRHIANEIVNDYSLGFAPPGWQFLCDQQPQSTHSNQTLKTLGLISTSKESTNKYYDRLRKRFIFPIRDDRGRFIAVGGRAMDDDQQPKYLNSPEHPAFQKRRTLYGLYEAKMACKQLTSLVIVEGYMDVVALACHGVRHAVATLGTAVTPQHLQVLFKHSSRLIFCFDGDAAGQKAAWRSCELSLPLMHDGREVAFIFLPDGDDPDSLIQREGLDAWHALEAQPTPLADFFFDTCASSYKLTDIAGCAAFAKTAKQTLEKLPAGIYKTLMMQRLSDMVQLPLDRITAATEEPATHTATPTATQTPPRQAKSLNPLLKKALRLILHYPQQAKDLVLADYPYANQEKPEKAWEMITELLTQINQAESLLNSGSLLARMQDHPHATWLAKQIQQSIITPESSARTELQRLLKAFDHQQLEQKISHLIESHKIEPLKEHDKKQLQHLLRIKSNYDFDLETDS